MFTLKLPPPGALVLFANVTVDGEQRQATLNFSSNQGDVVFKCTHFQSSPKLITPCKLEAMLDLQTHNRHILN